MLSFSMLVDSDIEKGVYMFKKVLLVSSFFGLVFANPSIAIEDTIADNVFINLLKCMENAPLDQEDYKGVSYQQIVLNSVLENLTKQKIPSVSGLEVDYSKVYELVVKYCPKELEVVKKFAG
jgi:hypothetical protein